MLSIINEKHSIFNIVFLTKLSKKLLRQSCYSRCKEPYTREFVRSWINSGVQPKLLFINSDHRPVECDVIRICITGGL